MRNKILNFLASRYDYKDISGFNKKETFDLLIQTIQDLEEDVKMLSKGLDEILTKVGTTKNNIRNDSLLH